MIFVEKNEPLPFSLPGHAERFVYARLCGRGGTRHHASARGEASGLLSAENAVEDPVAEGVHQRLEAGETGGGLEVGRQAFVLQLGDPIVLRQRFVPAFVIELDDLIDQRELRGDDSIADAAKCRRLIRPFPPSRPTHRTRHDRVAPARSHP